MTSQTLETIAGGFKDSTERAMMFQKILPLLPRFELLTILELVPAQERAKGYYDAALAALHKQTQSLDPKRDLVYKHTLQMFDLLDPQEREDKFPMTCQRLGEDPVRLVELFKLLPRVKRVKMLKPVGMSVPNEGAIDFISFTEASQMRGTNIV